MGGVRRPGLGAGVTPHEAALLYAAELGWAPFPVTNAKLPLPGSHGHLDASPETEKINALFDGHHGGLALACGGASEPGLLVVDVDEKSGRSGHAYLAEHGIDLPPTLTAATRSGGRHYFYRWHSGGRSRNDVFGGECGVDVKADGGYVVAWPTEGYHWNQAKIGRWRHLPMPPDWAVIRRRAMSTQREWRPTSSSAVVDLYQTLDAVSNLIRQAEPGRRNDELNRLAFGIGLLIADARVDRGEAISKLTLAAKEAGLTSREIGWTLTSALRGAEETPDGR